MTLMAIVAMTTAMAQNPFGGMNFDPKEIAAKRTEEMTEKYKLSKEQSEKVKVLNENFFTNMRPGGPRPEHPQGGNPPQMNGGQRPERPQGGRPGFGPDMTKYNEELKGILTEEQYKAFEEDQAKRMAEMEKRMKEFMPQQ